MEAITLAVFRLRPDELDDLDDDEWVELSGKALFIWKAYWTNFHAGPKGGKR